MLKFESLELIGFKSFADKVRLEFHDNINAVVGPNGCGKSNLADALGWVLGEQSAKSLRGARMEDVIFNGTQKRKPSGFAEVTLRLSRTDQQPIVFEGVEISGDTFEITRKLYRSDQESTYLINQQRCRLKDIREILEAAGLGYASYALIEQGKIDSVLSAKPLERRALIEEAAQIIGYKAKRRNAELKLEMARQNLLRVNDIVLEVERQLRSLKRQAAKARRYRELKEEFRHLQRKKFALEAEHLRGQLRILDEELKDLKATEEHLKAELALREQSYRESLEKRDQLEASLAGLRQRRAEIHLEIDRAENAIQHHREQIEATQKQLEANAAEREIIALSLEKIANEWKEDQKERESLKQDEERIEEALSVQKQLVERYRVETRHAESQLEDLRTALLRLSADTASLRNWKEQLQQQLQSGAAGRERLEREKSGYALQLQESRLQLQEKAKTVSEKQNALALLRQELLEREKQKRTMESRFEELKEQITDLQNQLIANRERLESLQELEIKHSQYSEGVQQFLNHLHQSHAVQACGTLADFIETHPQYERLVEDFLSQELEYVLVDSLQEAVRGISELKSLKTGKCTFMSLRSTNGFGKGNGHHGLDLQKEEGVYGRLEDLVQLAPEVQEAFHRVLPQQAGAIVVSHLDRALQLAHSYPETTFVTLEGETLTPRGLLSAGSGQNQKLGLLSLKRQKKELEGKILQLQKALASLTQTQDEEQSRLEMALQQHAQIQDELFQLEKELISLNHQKEHWETEQHRQDQALRVLQDEILQLETEQQQQRERVQHIEQEVTEKAGAQSQAERLLSETQRNSRQLKVELDRVHEQLHLVSSDRKVMEERRLALERTLQRVEEQRRSLEERREATLAAKTQADARIRTMKATIDSLSTDLIRRREEAQETQETLQDQEKESTSWKEAHPQLENRLAELRQRRTQLQEDRARLDVQRTRLATQLQSLAEQCQDQLQLSVDELGAGLDLAAVTLDEIASSYADLKSRLDEFGPINMTALEEYQENEERFNFLTHQRQDIEQSIADTTRAIQEMNRRSREKFREAFDAVNRNFKEVFQTLFGGGDCGMQLLDEDDLLESGIDIYAQPPGKKLQNLMLLSGGEKALTALALLVALFQYRPSQFCVMDEVDAPLDDANVKRFTNLVQQMAESTQFIIITHNKKTMEVAQSLYGVTMQEPGVSQLVSVRF